MDFLPKEIEDIIIGYKVSAEKEERRVLYLLNNMNIASAAYDDAKDAIYTSRNTPTDSRVVTNAIFASSAAGAIYTDSIVAYNAAYATTDAGYYTYKKS